MTLDRLRSAWKGVEVARWLVEATCSMFTLFTDMLERSRVLDEGTKGVEVARWLVDATCTMLTLFTDMSG